MISKTLLADLFYQSFDYYFGFVEEKGKMFEIIRQYEVATRFPDSQCSVMKRFCKGFNWEVDKNSPVNYFSIFGKNLCNEDGWLVLMFH